MRIRAAVQKNAKKVPDGEEKAWNSIRKMAQPPYGKHKRKSFGKMLVPILYKRTDLYLDNTDDVKPFNPDKDKLGVEFCAPVGKQKHRRKAR